MTKRIMCQICDCFKPAVDWVLSDPGEPDWYPGGKYPENPERLYLCAEHYDIWRKPGRECYHVTLVREVLP